MMASCKSTHKHWLSKGKDSVLGGCGWTSQPHAAHLQARMRSWVASREASGHRQLGLV